MSRVALVTTGQLEYRALGTALNQLFPDVEFVSLPANRGPLNGFTSGWVSDTSAANNATTTVRKLVAQMVSSVEPGQPRSGRFDFAFLIDDHTPLGQPGFTARDRHPTTPRSRAWSAEV